MYDSCDLIKRRMSNEIIEGLTAIWPSCMTDRISLIVLDGATAACSATYVIKHLLSRDLLGDGSQSTIRAKITPSALGAEEGLNKNAVRS